jgi:Domain of unknown function (DUF1816)
MFESTLPLSLTLLTAVFLLLYIATKALMQAWKSSNLSAKDSEGTWGWWIEVKTVNPNYIYYFGPFSSTDEAKRLRPGYIQDLAEEAAEVTAATILWCRPQKLTYAQAASSELSACA